MLMPMDKGTASHILADTSYKLVNIDLSKDIDRSISEKVTKKTPQRLGSETQTHTRLRTST
jgi:hypothetical protein